MPPTRRSILPQRRAKPVVFTFLCRSRNDAARLIQKAHLLEVIAIRQNSQRGRPVDGAAASPVSLIRAARMLLPAEAAVAPEHL